MKILRLVFRLLWRTAVALLTFIAVYALAAWLLPMIPANADFVEAETGTLIYVRTNGVHTDLVVPLRSIAKDWSQRLPFANTSSKNSSATHVAFGWGDKDFYLETKEWADLKASTAFKAVSGLSGSAMHVTFCQPPALAANCKAVRVDDATLQKLCRLIESGFAKDDSGNLIWIADRYYGTTDSFYEGTGRYGLFFTCNTWTNKVLKDCGLPAAVWTAFDTGIIRHYE